MYTLRPTRHFDRRSQKFRDAHPELRRRLAMVLRDLEANPFQPHLKLHALRGELDGYHAVSVTYEHRILLILLVREREIILHDIGSHDEVYP